MHEPNIKNKHTLRIQVLETHNKDIVVSYIEP